MADEAKFYEGGVKMLVSVAMFAAGGPPGIMGAIGFVSGIVNFMTSDTTLPDALNTLKSQIEEIKSILTTIDQRLDELVEQVAILANRQTLARLNEHRDRIQILVGRLHDQPQDLDTAVEVANELGVIIDKFLRTDFEIWRWTDVVERDGQPALAIDRFKNVPTLPIYVMGMLAWLAARERVVQAGQTSRLDDDSARVSRHLDAVSVRDVFDKYRDDESGTPVTIAENIRWRVRAFVLASDTLAVDRTCHFFFDARNWMNGTRKTGDNFDLLMDSDNALCTVDPSSLGAPNLELDMETEAGVEVLRELAETLTRVKATGSLREQLIGVFPTTKVFPPATLYVIAQNGDLHWYRNESSSQPGGSTAWMGPKTIGTGFHGFTSVFNSGGVAMYGIQPDGTLLWYGYDGFVDGSPNWLNDAQPKPVGTGWDSFKLVFSGGEFVIYGIHPDGELYWYRHHGARFGGATATDWSGGIVVSSGWQDFVKVFSGGDGVIYAISPDGALFRTVHTGYLTGAPDWEALEQIAIGWGGFLEVVASFDGVIYGFTRDGRILWTRYGPRTPSVRPRVRAEKGSLLGELSHHPHHVVGLPVVHLPVWEGPVEVKHGVPGFRSVFALMGEPFAGPH